MPNKHELQSTKKLDKENRSILPKEIFIARSRQN
jgi:hypothetical protein